MKISTSESVTPAVKFNQSVHYAGDVLVMQDEHRPGLIGQGRGRAIDPSRLWVHPVARHVVPGCYREAVFDEIGYGLRLINADRANPFHSA